MNIFIGCLRCWLRFLRFPTDKLYCYCCQYRYSTTPIFMLWNRKTIDELLRNRHVFLFALLIPLVSLSIATRLNCPVNIIALATGYALRDITQPTYNIAKRTTNMHITAYFVIGSGERLLLLLGCYCYCYNYTILCDCHIGVSIYNNTQNLSNSGFVDLQRKWLL